MAEEIMSDAIDIDIGAGAVEPMKDSMILIIGAIILAWVLGIFG